VVRQLGRARAETAARGPSRLMAVAAALFVFGFGCVAILGIVALVSGWRRAAELEPGDGDEHYVYGEASEDDAWFGHGRGLPRSRHGGEEDDDAAAQRDVIGFRGARGS
jgi:hypothetical protein